ncbi:MAG: hypothetical protein H0X17_01075 [Deltaproteobacteria bacterium]|nr:hypothetical protein [Deltaproteobacteria bacterium]
MTRFTYQGLVDLVEGDHDLIEHLVEEGLIERRDEDDNRVIVDVDRVLVARTLWRDLDVDWHGIEVILRLCDELASARQRIAELELALARRP